MSVKAPVLYATRICDADRTALAADNADYTVNKGSKPNLIFVAQVDEEVGTYTTTYTLMWKNTTDTGAFANLAATGQINWAATTNLVQGTNVTTKLCTAVGAAGSTWQNGEEVEGAATSDSIALVDEYYTEIHFAINIASALEGKTYDFQIWENTGGTALAVAAAASLIVTSDQPTVVLNTADLTDFGADTTPTLEFTGTDASGSDVRYNIQIDTSSNFDSGGFGSEALLDSYAEANASASLTCYNGYFEQVGQTFRGNGGKISSCKFYLAKAGLPTGNVYAKLYAHTGTFGTSGMPTGAALATSDAYDVATIGALALVTFTFSGANQVKLTSGTPYCIAFSIDGIGDLDNRVDMELDNTAPTHEGNRFRTHDSSNWTSTVTDDIIFYVYELPLLPLLDKVSGTDAGFVGDPDNTDPFASAQLVSYTVQAGEELTTDTYYWRVRGLDPSPGSGLYGAWAATRQFDVDTGGAPSAFIPRIIMF